MEDDDDGEEEDDGEEPSGKGKQPLKSGLKEELELFSEKRLERKGKSSLKLVSYSMQVEQEEQEEEEEGKGKKGREKFKREMKGMWFNVCFAKKKGLY